MASQPRVMGLAQLLKGAIALLSSSMAIQCLEGSGAFGDATVEEDCGMRFSITQKVSA